MTAAEQAPDPGSSVSPAAALQTIAHELRQPLGAIESIAYYLAMVLPHSEARAREQVARLQLLVEQSNWIVNCGLQLLDTGPPRVEPVDLAELIAQVVARCSVPAAPGLHLEVTGDLPLVQIDPACGGALISNLLTLFQQWSSPAYPVRLSTERTDTGVRLTLASAVPGHRPEAPLEPGCALGLASARRVIAAHRGTCEFDMCPRRGITLSVTFPSGVLP